MYHIRPFEPTQEEYEACVAVHNAYWTDDQTTASDWQAWDERHNQRYLNQRFVTIQGNEIIAFSSCNESSWSYVPGKYRFEITIHPQHETPESMAQHYDYLMAYLHSRTPAPKILDSYAREDKALHIDFLSGNGFKMIMRDATSKIDLADYDYTPFEGAFSRAEAAGIRLMALPQVQAEIPDWNEKYYRLEIAVDQDIPQPDAPTPQPIEEFNKMLTHPKYLPDAHFFAVDGAELVGLSTLWPDSTDNEKMHVGVTGILRSHRRKGIATALKLLTFRYAQARNARYIKTENEENNPMYDLNVALGFRPEPAWLTYRKELTDA